MEIKRILLENEIHIKTVKDYEKTIGQLEAQINQFNRTNVIDMTDKQEVNRKVSNLFTESIISFFLILLF